MTGRLKSCIKNDIFKIKINTSSIRCLGTCIYIGHNKDKWYQKKWKDKCENTKNKYESWKTRKLTMFGKTKIVYTLGKGKFIYRASILPLPNENVIKTLYGHISNFIWNKKK